MMHPGNTKVSPILLGQYIHCWLVFQVVRASCSPTRDMHLTRSLFVGMTYVRSLKLPDLLRCPNSFAGNIAIYLNGYAHPDTECLAYM